MLHNAYGYGLFTGGLGIHLGADALGLSTVPISGGMTPRQVRLIEDFKPKGITVTPSYALSILDEFAAQGLDPRECSLEVGIFGAEPWTNAMRLEIEQAFDMHAVDIYGLSEVMGPGVSMECVETKDGLHIWEDHFYPEIINPETGEPVADGEQGELVFTSLTKEAFPIIRYRTRDLTRLLPGTARSMRRMEKVTGRSDDMIILRGVNVFPTQIEEALMATTGPCAAFPDRAVAPRPDGPDARALRMRGCHVTSDARTAAPKRCRPISSRRSASRSRSRSWTWAALPGQRAKPCAFSITDQRAKRPKPSRRSPLRSFLPRPTRCWCGWGWRPWSLNRPRYRRAWALKRCLQRHVGVQPNPTSCPPYRIPPAAWQAWAR